MVANAENEQIEEVERKEDRKEEERKEELSRDENGQEIKDSLDSCYDFGSDTHIKRGNDFGSDYRFTLEQDHRLPPSPPGCFVTPFHTVRGFDAYDEKSRAYDQEAEGKELDFSSVSLSPSPAASDADADVDVDPVEMMKSNRMSQRRFVFHESNESYGSTHNVENFKEILDSYLEISDDEGMDEATSDQKQFSLSFVEVDVELEGESEFSVASELSIQPSNILTGSWIKPAFFSNEGQIALRCKGVELIQTVSEALNKNVLPIEVENGVTGAFFMKNPVSGYAGVFKCEEVLSRRSTYYRNTSTSSFDGLLTVTEKQELQEREQEQTKRGVRLCETSVREVAAYLLDHESFVNVPETVMVKINAQAFHHLNTSHCPAFERNCRQSPPPMARRCNSLITDYAKIDQEQEHVAQNVQRTPRAWKVGSLQKFVAHDLDAYDIGPSKLSLEMIQRIGMFDVRVLNTDRHEGNILIKLEESNNFDGPINLTPIDHGFILPDYESINVEGNFCWLYWPQSKQKFTPEIKAYIQNLSAEKDCKMLMKLLGSKLSLRGLLSLKIGTELLKVAVLKHDLSLHQIGKIIVASNLENSGFEEAHAKNTTSPLLKMIELAKTETNFTEVGRNDKEFINCFSCLLSSYIEHETEIGEAVSK